MKQIITLLLVFVITSFSEVLSQNFTLEFTETARTTKLNGFIRDITIGPDGTIFVAHEEHGLRAYTYDGSSFTNTAHIDDGGTAEGVAVSSDGTIFLANGFDGLRAYTYDGSSFANTDTINVVSKAVGVTVADYGYIYLNTRAYLRVYIYHENFSSFESIAHIFTVYGNRDIAIGADSTIFLCCGGLSAYKHYGYYGTSLINTAHIDDVAEGIAISADETIFLANRSEGLKAYTYDGSSFTNTAHTDDVFARKVFVSSDGTIFVNCSDGFRAYTYNGNSFANIAHMNDSSSVLEITDEGTIFCGNKGILIAYEYSKITSVKENEIPTKYSLSQNYPNPFNPSSTIQYTIPVEGKITNSKLKSVVLRVYDVLGKEVATLVNEKQTPGNYEVVFDATSLSSGIYFYRLTAGASTGSATSFVETKKMILLR